MAAYSILKQEKIWTGESQTDAKVERCCKGNILEVIPDIRVSYIKKNKNRYLVESPFP